MTTDFKNKSQEELMELQRNATPGGAAYIHLTDEIEGIRKDTKNRQDAGLIEQMKKLNTNLESFNRSSSKLQIALLILTAVMAFAAIMSLYN